MSILISLLIVMSILSLITVVGATVVASRSDRDRSEWRDIQELERVEAGHRRFTPTDTVPNSEGTGEEPRKSDVGVPVLKA